MYLAIELYHIEYIPICCTFCFTKLSEFDNLQGGEFLLLNLSRCQMFRNKCVSITTNGLDSMTRGNNMQHTNIYFHFFFFGAVVHFLLPFLLFKRQLPPAMIMVAVAFSNKKSNTQSNFILMLPIFIQYMSNVYKYVNGAFIA